MEVIKEEVTNAPIPAHIHSGETHHFSTTKVDEIRVFDGMTTTAGLHAIYFTTYHSLPRLAEAGISVDSIYFDEAHNSTQSNFFPATQYFSQTAQRCFFFTATPKHSATVRKAGMNDTSVSTAMFSSMSLLRLSSRQVSSFPLALPWCSVSWLMLRV